jgi:hypothetical protein
MDLTIGEDLMADEECVYKREIRQARKPGTGRSEAHSFITTSPQK